MHPIISTMNYVPLNNPQPVSCVMDDIERVHYGKPLRFSPNGINRFADAPFENTTIHRLQNFGPLNYTQRHWNPNNTQIVMGLDHSINAVWQRTNPYAKRLPPTEFWS